MNSWILRIKEEITSFSTQERLFILFAMLCGFFISAEYAITRPVSSALFLSSYGSASLPYAWIAAVPLNFFLVACYQRYLPKLGCFKLFLCTTVAVVTISLFSAFTLSKLTWFPFFFYMWKEVYILLMFQQLWSVIHLTISFRKASYLYGIFFAVGAFGAFLGSLLPSFLAVQMGSESLLLSSLPLYALLLGCYHFVIKHSKVKENWNPDPQESSPKFLKGFTSNVQDVLSSRYLKAILFIVVFMQLSSTLIDFQFNSFLEKMVGSKDLRTQYTAQVLSVVHLLTIGLQLIGSFLCVRYLGVRRSHLSIPAVLAGSALLFQWFPVFGIISLSFVCVKSFDFSLFTVIKELLYIPLTPREKFQAKAVIDVFAHRSSKAIGSCVILGLKVLFGMQFLPFLGWIGILFFALWMAVVVRWLKEAPQETESVQS